MEMSVPKLEFKKEQPYLGLRAQVQMRDIGKALPALHNQLADWLENKKIPASGAPFFRYLVFNSDNAVDVEVGIPVASQTEGDERVRSGVLPSGKYAVLLHTGHYSGLFQATHTLLEWGKKNGITWMKAEANGAEAWEARLEIYLNVGLEKDPAKWKTELAFLTAQD